MSEATAGAHSEHSHAEYPFLAHHYDTPEHQFDSGKLGIWLFLVTEVLFFSGLFCAYAIYRSLHPEVFEYAHYFLDTRLGAVNTCVLIASSVSAAWSVRNAQLRQRRLLLGNILFTIACGLIFMGVKYVEYSHKVHSGLLPGTHYTPHHRVWELPEYQKHYGIPEGVVVDHAAEHAPASKAESAKGTGQGAVASAAPSSAGTGAALGASAAAGAAAAVTGAPVHKKLIGPHEFNVEPRNVHRFFSIYFCMTGLHGIHVVAGIGIWVWLLVRAWRGDFGPDYFGPIDYAALYWHLVDLIWIYLFPLLYLIH